MSYIFSFVKRKAQAHYNWSYTIIYLAMYNISHPKAWKKKKKKKNSMQNGELDAEYKRRMCYERVILLLLSIIERNISPDYSNSTNNSSRENLENNKKSNHFTNTLSGRVELVSFTLWCVQSEYLLFSSYFYFCIFG